jgi:hypothetical protein
MIYAPPVELQQLARGLWRWTPPNPDWEPRQEHAALVLGDRLLGDRPPGLPIEMVLVSHGEPMLRNGRAAGERALAQ